MTREPLNSVRAFKKTSASVAEHKGIASKQTRGHVVRPADTSKTHVTALLSNHRTARFALPSESSDSPC